MATHSPGNLFEICSSIVSWALTAELNEVGGLGHIVIDLMHAWDNLSPSERLRAAWCWKCAIAQVAVIVLFVVVCIPAIMYGVIIEQWINVVSIRSSHRYATIPMIILAFHANTSRSNAKAKL